MKLCDLNEKQRGMIDPEDRKRHKIRLLSEKLAKAKAGREKEEHNTVLSWCNRNRVKCIHAPCSRKVKDLEPGFPDFMFYRAGRYLLVEMKVTNGALSSDQLKFHQELHAQHDQVNLTWSAEETIRLLLSWLWEHWRIDPRQFDPIPEPSC